jgi:hypothetical protein
MDIPGRVQLLCEEFGPESYERAQLFRAELLSHFRAVERDAREDCRRAAQVRSQAAAATGDAAGAKAAGDVAAFIAEGRVES